MPPTGIKEYTHKVKKRTQPENKRAVTYTGGIKLEVLKICKASDFFINKKKYDLKKTWCNTFGPCAVKVHPPPHGFWLRKNPCSRLQTLKIEIVYPV